MVLLAFLAGLSLAVVASPSLAAARGDDPLSAYRDRSRVLAVVAPDASDPRLAEQRRIYAAMRVGAHERDLVLLEGIGTSAQARALRTRFGAEKSDFRAVLIGKDGGDKLMSRTPLGPDQLFPLIDAMPMRQDEMRRRQP